MVELIPTGIFGGSFEILIYGVIFLLILGVPGILIYKFKLWRKIPFLTKWPVKIIIFEKRGNTLYPRDDKARRITTDGEEKYELLSGGTTKPISFKHLLYGDKGNFGLLYSPSSGQYLPLSPQIVEQDGIDPSILKMMQIPEDMKFWYTTEQAADRNRWKKESIWSKYFPLFAMGGMAIALFIIIYATATYWWTPTINNANNLLALQNQYLDKFTNAINSLKTISNTPPSDVVIPPQTPPPNTTIP